MKRDNIHILYRYILASNDWCSADELASHLHTTNRTIRNYVREINQSSQEGVLILSSHKGYRWNKDISHNTLPGSVPHILKTRIPVTPDERCWYIIRKIIIEKIDIDSLIDNLIISDRTIDTDIQKVRKIAKTHNIRLRRRRDTLSFSGKESDIRLLSYHCILETTKHEAPSYDFIIDAFPEYKCGEINTILKNILSKYGLTANAYTQYDLLLLVILQYRQIDSGMSITTSECPIDGLQNYYDFTIACELADALANHSGNSYNLWEREYLATLLISKTDTPYISKCALIPGFISLKNTTIACLQMAGYALHTDLSEDAFVDYLSCYFQRLLVRQTMRLISKDLVFQSLKNSHPVIQDVSAWILLFLSRQYHIKIERNEVGFLTKILCDFVLKKGYSSDISVNCTLICPSFGDFPDRLVLTLEQHLGNAITIQSIIDSLDVDNLEDSFSLYLSVLPVQNIQHLVHISLYPRAADFRHIYTEIHKIKMNLYSEQLFECLKDYLTADTFEIGTSLSSKSGALRHMCKKLMKLGYVNEQFQEQIIERECIDSSVFCNNIAIPHTSDKSVYRSFIYLIISQRPIPWENDQINIICMIGTIENHIQEMQLPYDLAIKVFSFYRNVNTLLNAYDLDSFMDILKSTRFLLY